MNDRIVNIFQSFIARGNLAGFLQFATAAPFFVDLHRKFSLTVSSYLTDPVREKRVVAVDAKKAHLHRSTKKEDAVRVAEARRQRELSNLCRITRLPRVIV